MSGGTARCDVAGYAQRRGTQFAVPSADNSMDQPTGDLAQTCERIRRSAACAIEAIDAAAKVTEAQVRVTRQKAVPAIEAERRAALETRNHCESVQPVSEIFGSPDRTAFSAAAEAQTNDTAVKRRRRKRQRQSLREMLKQIDASETGADPFRVAPDSSSAEHAKDTAACAPTVDAAFLAVRQESAANRGAAEFLRTAAIEDAPAPAATPDFTGAPITEAPRAAKASAPEAATTPRQTGRDATQSRRRAGDFARIHVRVPAVRITKSTSLAAAIVTLVLGAGATVSILTGGSGVPAPQSKVALELPRLASAVADPSGPVLHETQATDTLRFAFVETSQLRVVSAIRAPQAPNLRDPYSATPKELPPQPPAPATAPAKPSAPAPQSQPAIPRQDFARPEPALEGGKTTISLDLKSIGTGAEALPILHVDGATPVALPIAIASSPDLSQIGAILFKGLPRGTEFSAGRRIDATSWGLRPADLNGLKIAFLGARVHELKLDISVYRKDGVRAAAKLVRIAVDHKQPIVMARRGVPLPEISPRRQRATVNRGLQVASLRPVARPAASPRALPPLPGRRGVGPRLVSDAGPKANRRARTRRLARKTAARARKLAAVVERTKARAKLRKPRYTLGSPPAAAPKPKQQSSSFINSLKPKAAEPWARKALNM